MARTLTEMTMVVMTPAEKRALRRTAKRDGVSMGHVLREGAKLYAAQQAIRMLRRSGCANLETEQ